MTAEHEHSVGPTVGLCGLGNMGLAIATRLTGYGTVVAFDPQPDRRALAADRGVQPVSSVTEVADRAGTVVLSLPAPAVSREVAGQLADRLPAGGLLIETSTVLPDDVRHIQQRCASFGIGVVDAAILSGVGLVESGGSALLLGGDPADVDRARPVLDTIAARQTVFGPAGAGMAAKVINNAVAHAVYVVLAEATAMGAATGITIPALVELLTGADAGLTRPLTHRIAERVARGDYAGGMPTEAAHKDSTLALRLAQDHGIPLFATQAAHTVYEIARGTGLARQDYAAVATLWEQWTGRPLDSDAPPDGTGAR